MTTSESRPDDDAAPPSAALAPPAPDTSAAASSAPFDQAQLEALYVRLEPRVFNVVYRWLWNREDAADVVQDAFAKLWSMRDRVRAQTVEALVYRIAVNLAANRRRQRRVWGWVTLDGLRAAGRALDDDAADEARRVRAAVDALPERLRRVVVLGEFSGMTAKEIGAVLGVPEGTVASRRHQALGVLRAALGGLMDADGAGPDARAGTASSRAPASTYDEPLRPGGPTSDEGGAR